MYPRSHLMTHGSKEYPGVQYEETMVSVISGGRPGGKPGGSFPRGYVIVDPAVTKLEAGGGGRKGHWIRSHLENSSLQVP